ncbi:hypothetical protein PoMZ_08445 [Pyricularia oryzae]|uniref:Uncharacterized protein n=1 Tax=Pyricularia oryzae TaxID=318829 RepID=A0A4P7NHW6_PYROR|nr:hypothetical protein PoMZ_08445 [Pyricularia oryzae]
MTIRWCGHMYFIVVLPLPELNGVITKDLDDGWSSNIGSRRAVALAASHLLDHDPEPTLALSQARVDIDLERSRAARSVDELVGVTTAEGELAAVGIGAGFEAHAHGVDSAGARCHGDTEPGQARHDDWRAVAAGVARVLVTLGCRGRVAGGRQLRNGRQGGAQAPGGCTGSGGRSHNDGTVGCR